MMNATSNKPSLKQNMPLLKELREIELVESDFEDDLSECIGTALMVVRMHRGTSQVSLAQMLTDGAGETVTQGYVSKVETGRTRVSWERLALFCKCLKCLPHQVTKLAEFLAKQADRPDRDVIADLLKDTGARLEK